MCGQFALRLSSPFSQHGELTFSSLIIGGPFRFHQSLASGKLLSLSAFAAASESAPSAVMPSHPPCQSSDMGYADSSSRAAEVVVRDVPDSGLVGFVETKPSKTSPNFFIVV
jgi:hypothetical protein